MPSCVLYRRFFRTRSNLLENDEISLENFEVQQLKKRVQYDAYNCEFTV